LAWDVGLNFITLIWNPNTWGFSFEMNWNTPDGGVMFVISSSGEVSIDSTVRMTKVFWRSLGDGNEKPPSLHDI
jgi:hypothetical protein